MEQGLEWAGIVIMKMISYLSLEHAVWSDDFVKNVFSNMGVDSTEGIIQKVDVCVLVH